MLKSVPVLQVRRRLLCAAVRPDREVRTVIDVQLFNKQHTRPVPGGEPSHRNNCCRSDMYQYQYQVPGTVVGLHVVGTCSVSACNAFGWGPG
jgi:hypothetical protein